LKNKKKQKIGVVRATPLGKMGVACLGVVQPPPKSEMGVARLAWEWFQSPATASLGVAELPHGL
jgi:hypothetical protein